MIKNSYEYNFEIETCLKQFIATIDNCSILRYDVDEDTKKRHLVETIKPLYVFGTKQRVMIDAINDSKNAVFPIIVIEIKGIKASKDRLAAKQNIISKFEDNNTSSYTRPTPISISVKLSIITKLITDLYQIYGKLCGQFQPYQFYSWYVPKEGVKSDEELRNKIEWDFNLSLDTSDGKISGEQKDKFIGSLSFEIESWIFPQMKMYDDNMILNIGTNKLIKDELNRRIIDDTDAFRPLMSLIQGNKNFFNEYNNPREFANHNPRIVNVFSCLKRDSNNIYFNIDKTRNNLVILNDNTKYFALDGYNLKDCKILFVPTENYETIDKKTKVVFDAKKLFPNKYTLDSKNRVITGYELVISHSSDNEIIFSTKNIKYNGEYDIIIYNNIDYDTISNAIDSKLISIL